MNAFDLDKQIAARMVENVDLREQNKQLQHKLKMLETYMNTQFN